MKIAVFSEKLWPEGSGGELATYLLLKLLSRERDFRIEVYTGTSNYAEISSVSIKRVGFLESSNKVQLFVNIIVNRNLVEKIVMRADVVYIPRFCYPVVPIARKLGRKVIVHLHGYQPVSYTAAILSSEAEKPLNDVSRTLIVERESGLLRSIACSVVSPLTYLIRKWVNMTDRIVLVSRRHEELVLKMIPECRGRTVVIYNPPPEIPDTGKELTERPMLLYVGGDSYVKGFHTLLKALRILDKNIQMGFKLVMTNRYGAGSLKVIELLKRRYGLNIEVLRRVDYGELMKLHSKAWALVFPSTYEEPLPYAIVESMVVGTVPIASRVGGVPELVEGTFAEKLMFPPGNTRELANRFSYFLNSVDNTILTDIALKLKEDVLKKLNKDEIRRNFIKIFESV